MIMRAAIVLLGSVAALSTLPVVPPDPSPVFVDDPEAYAIYTSLLSHESTKRPADVNALLVFQEETVTKWYCMPSGKPFEEDWRPVIDSFRSENIEPRRLRARFPIETRYLVVPSADITASFDQVAHTRDLGWGDFYKRYPGSGGFIVVSAVGFDASKKRAMVYMAHSCGPLCGGGTHHLLEKVDGTWRAAAVPGVSFCRWVS
jgi:hypothetical protein